MTEEYDADLSSSLESVSGENIEIEIIEEEITPKKEKKEKKPKEKKPRKPMTPEHKAKLLAGLQKARMASNLARAKRSQVKKIQKEKEAEEVDRILRENLLAKSKKTDDKDKEIERLKKKLESLTLQDVIKKPPKKIRQRPPTPEEYIILQEIEEPEEIEESEPEPEPVSETSEPIREKRKSNVKGRRKKNYF